MTIRAGAPVWLVAGAVVALLLLVAAARLAAPPPADPPAGLVGPEPAAAAAFVAAYARGDEVGAEELASPLYRAEWARRGISAVERVALRASPAVLIFRYVGGVQVDGGFGRLLYTVRATAADGRSSLSAWRADVDPAGRVVWTELVWLFSDEVEAVVPVGAADDAPHLALRPDTDARRAVVLIGLRAAGRREGYYALGRPAAPGRPFRTGFAAVDADGELRPGVWSYGLPAGVVEYGVRSPRVEIALPPDLAALRSAYLRALP